MAISKEEALEYHRKGRPGKIEVRVTKPCVTQHDLSIAYTPGVADPCLEIEKDPSLAATYTARQNLVAVISNGTATLGLGDIGALACKPVMEGKGVLFKRFADIDVFDIELDTKDPAKIIEATKMMEPTFGGINLEDIKAPECFIIEETLEREMDIPVFHDDQHGTAIISAAGLINYCELTGKRMEDIRITINGAGASGLACAAMYISLGVKREHVAICDSKGLIYQGRESVNEYKAKWAVPDDGRRTLADAAKDSDVLLGLSVAGQFTPEIVKTLAPNPAIFAMANPTPEIFPDEVTKVRDDAFMATGRSDYPNQINNVLGFPFIFRGALDVHSRDISPAMKVAASWALAKLAREDVPDNVCKAYGVSTLRFGQNYIIPKPFDPRVLLWEAYAVAEASVREGTARLKDFDLDAYRDELERRLGRKRHVMATVIRRVKDAHKRILFPEGTNDKIIRSAVQACSREVCTPVLLGNEAEVKGRIEDLKVSPEGIEILDPASVSAKDELARIYQDRFRLEGKTYEDAMSAMEDPFILGSLLTEAGRVDGVVGGITAPYPAVAKKMLSIAARETEVQAAAAMHAIVLSERTVFFCDTALNVDPTPKVLSSIALAAAQTVEAFAMTPRVAMLSYNAFGQSSHPQATKMAAATRITKERKPSLEVIGECPLNYALFPEEFGDTYPAGQTLSGPANVFVFPNLDAANQAVRLMRHLGDAEIIGPLILGLQRQHIPIPQDMQDTDIVYMAALAALSDIWHQKMQGQE